MRSRHPKKVKVEMTVSEAKLLRRAAAHGEEWLREDAVLTRAQRQVLESAYEILNNGIVRAYL